ncbi:cytochrome c family protein, partial [Desulfovibrio sp. OttesenSCG-928-C14]|nr:cytochrome c family protein [Desulfovibrio sp. OttesenSCG-928-C14]
MKRNRSLPRCLAFLAAVAALSLSMAFTAGVGVSASGPRPDVLTLDGGLAPGKAKLPPVSFLHDAHTEATMQNGWNCAMCHADISAKNPSYKFKRAGVRVSPDDVQAYYHQGCISCHDNVSGAPG